MHAVNEIKTTPNCATNFKLVIPDDVYQKIAYWMGKTKNEVSGFGSLEWNEERKEFRVKDVILLKQEVGKASTEIDPIAIGKAMFLMKDEPMGLKWHWHTHPNMGVFWSGDDMEIIRSLGQQGWILATVFNDAGLYKSAFYTKTQVLGKDHDIFKDDLPTEIVRFMPRAFFSSLDTEYDANVKEAARWVGPGSYTKLDSEYEDYYPKKVVTGETHTNEPSRWEKPVYNNFGYASLGDNDYMYNPLHDGELLTDEARLNMIGEMDTHEIEYLRVSDTDFQGLYSRYLVREASSHRNEILTSEAAWRN